MAAERGAEVLAERSGDTFGDLGDCDVAAAEQTLGTDPLGGSGRPGVAARVQGRAPAARLRLRAGVRGTGLRPRAARLTRARRYPGGLATAVARAAIPGRVAPESPNQSLNSFCQACLLIGRVEALSRTAKGRHAWWMLGPRDMRVQRDSAPST